VFYHAAVAADGLQANSAVSNELVIWCMVRDGALVTFQISLVQEMFQPELVVTLISVAADRTTPLS
jgi:hypothetical protein